MKKIKIGAPLILGLALSINSISAQAGPIDLNDWGFNVDGAVSLCSAPGVNCAAEPMPLTGSLNSSGLGTLNMTIAGAGSHSFTSFFDFEMVEPQNTFYNEYGFTSGTAAAGQSWEIDEPGYVFGNIFDHLWDGNLDNTNSVPAGLEEDVSFGMDWDFNLLADETAVIELILSDTLDTNEFYLAHVDSDSDTTIYFWSSMTIRDSTQNIPEPGTLFLLSAGLIGFAGLRRRNQ